MAGRAFLDSRRRGPGDADATTRDPRGDLRQPLPLHGLRADRRGDPAGGARAARAGDRRSGANAAPAPAVAPDATAGPDRALLDLDDPDAETPRTLGEAYALLAEGGWRPLAGGTDALVERAAGIPGGARLPRPGGARRAARDPARGRRARPRRGHHVRGAAPQPARRGARSGPRRDGRGGRRRPDPEPRHARRQHRDGVAGRRQPAGPARARRGDRGRRRAAASGPSRPPAFFPAYRRTALAADELILRIRIPLAPEPHGRLPQGRHAAGPGDQRGRARRRLALGRRGTWRDVRVALGSVAPTPIRARATEAVLEGAPPTAEVADRRRRDARRRDRADRRRSLHGRVPPRRRRPRPPPHRPRRRRLVARRPPRRATPRSRGAPPACRPRRPSGCAAGSRSRRPAASPSRRPAGATGAPRRPPRSASPRPGRTCRGRGRPGSRAPRTRSGRCGHRRSGCVGGEPVGLRRRTAPSITPSPRSMKAFDDCASKSARSR